MKHRSVVALASSWWIAPKKVQSTSLELQHLYQVQRTGGNAPHQSILAGEAIATERI
jgi:hypothetical protein